MNDSLVGLESLRMVWRGMTGPRLESEGHLVAKESRDLTHESLEAIAVFSSGRRVRVTSLPPNPLSFPVSHGAIGRLVLQGGDRGEANRLQIEASIHVSVHPMFTFTHIYLRNLTSELADNIHQVHLFQFTIYYEC
jgi:hypothetical protein